VPTVGNLTFHEYNDEVVYATIFADVDRTIRQDLTGTVVQFIYKTSASQADEDALVISAMVLEPVLGTIQIDVTNELVSLSRKFFRIDVLSGAERKTAIYGNITVVDL
jgi:hypothetical protein